MLQEVIGVIRKPDNKLNIALLPQTKNLYMDQTRPAPNLL